jgi:hypothetical protein
MNSTKIDPKKFYRPTDSHLVKSGEDWDESEYANLVEVFWLPDDFEYGWKLTRLLTSFKKTEKK